jgi:hypothetical protein
MMRFSRIGFLALGALVFAACKGDDGVTVAPNVPVAYTRFMHAVPDTSAMDWRFVDVLENSPVALGLAFRSFTPYQATGVGARHLKIFTTSTDITITSQALIDTTITFEANAHYTLVHVGLARAGQTPADRLLVIQDNIPDVATGSVAVRAVNLGVGLGNLDFFASASGGTTPLPSTPTFANVAYLAASPYTNITPGPLALRVTTAGQVSPVMIDATAPAGQAGTPSANLNPVGGSTLGGSAFTAFAFPRSVAGSSAASFTTPGIVYVIDRNPK